MKRTYHITYDAFKRAWKVTAQWPGPDGEILSFTCSRHASLDRARRAALAYRRADEHRQDENTEN